MRKNRPDFHDEVPYAPTQVTDQSEAQKNQAIEVRDVVNHFVQEFLASRSGVILPSQLKALNDIVNCRTAALGGRRYHCEDCDLDFWNYHSCRNRSCPACHGARTREWIQAREAQLLGCEYFHIIATVPAPLRATFLADQKRMYSLLLKTVADSVIELAADRKYVGGLPAVMAVLHTWSSDLNYHPHVHLLVSAGGLSPDGEYWMKPRYRKWLVPVKALSALIRGKFCARLKKMDRRMFQKIPSSIWRKGWNTFCKVAGPDPDAVVKYLGRYVFRTAISNARIVSMDKTHVTIRVRRRKKGGGENLLPLTGEEFLRRFVMHVLPRGFQKVRYYGLWHHSRAKAQESIARLLGRVKAQTIDQEEEKHDEAGPETIAEMMMSQAMGMIGGTGDGGCEGIAETGKVKCPACGSSKVQFIEEVARNGTRMRSP